MAQLPVLFGSSCYCKCNRCPDICATNYDGDSNIPACSDKSCCTYPTDPVRGCTQVGAINYNPCATIDDGSCPEDPNNPPPPCSFPLDAECAIDVVYTNINAIQDDAFDIFFVKKDGTEVKAGSIDGACQAYVDRENSPCVCTKVDVVSFFRAIKLSDYINVGGSCHIAYKIRLTKNNGCFTYAYLSISGPGGAGSSFILADDASGYFTISNACRT